MDTGVAIAKSDFLSFTGYRIAKHGDTVEKAYGFNDGVDAVAGDGSYNVALVLDRNDPSTLDPMLQGSWASRQQALQDPDLWTKYGADAQQYAYVTSALIDAGFQIIDANDPANEGFYTSTPENRTIWVHLTGPDDFNKLFSNSNEKLLKYSESADLLYWNKDLTLPAEWNVKGLWFDTDTSPNAAKLVSGHESATLPQGPQGIGNSGNSPNLSPAKIAELYNFPLKGEQVTTGTIGLIEPGVGSYTPSDPTGAQFQALLDAYLAGLPKPISGTGLVSVQGIAGQTSDGESSMGERSLDVGVVSAINPNSNIQLYNGSGYRYSHADASIFTAIQSSIWNPAGDLPAVTSNSFNDPQSMAPDSPYYWAYWQLFIDAALKNQTTVVALGDGGSAEGVANGLTNVDYNVSQPYNLLVSGTSLSSQSVAAGDPTLVSASYLAQAAQGNKGVLWQLVMGGLTTMPSSSSDISKFIETVWNEYTVNGARIEGYAGNNAASGGVDVTQVVPPWYQSNYGLNPVTSDGTNEGGRGVPDVSANAAGNLYYLVPEDDMVGAGGDGGTSAASPLWASLITQFNFIFKDQGLPNLGFMNDLLYIASVIAPASFNDITIGSNNSSYYVNLASGQWIVDGQSVTPTDFGYEAGQGYDYVSGLGTPNGILLGRALSAIAHSQSFSISPDMLVSDGMGGWASGADQTLLFQTAAASATSVGVDLGGSSLGYMSGSTQAFAWTAMLAQQSLQPDFDPNLVRLFDKAAQGTVAQIFAGDGDSLSVSMGGSGTEAYQVGLSSPYGYASFLADNNNGGVTVARAVAVAETAGGADDQTAVVRVRQNGQDNTAISFYQVDDFSGTIGGLRPGDAGYAAAAQAAAYQLASGGTVLYGPGYGNYAHAKLLDIDAGDLVAMRLYNNSSGQSYWAFAQSNPDGLGHLWSYGLNTWGWEDVLGGGDLDYNDMIVQLDFTSASGSSLLV